MKKILFTIAGLFFGLCVNAQKNADPVLMVVNGKEVTRSEFEYSFNKNNADGVLDKKTVEEYVPLFVNFKLKVAAAQDAKIDTLDGIRKELRGYKEQIVMPTIVDTAFIEREARNTYNATAAHFAGSDMLVASHILLFLRQDAPAADEAKAKTRIDSIYSVLAAVPKAELPKKFAELATALSEDKGSAQRGGSLGQFGKGQMIPEFEEAAYALKSGELSKPVKTAVGYHLIYLSDRHPFEPYEYHHDAIIKFLESRGIKEQSANVYVDSLSRVMGVTRDLVIDSLFEDITSKDSDLRYLSQEYYDGTLMFEMCKTRIWDKAQQDEAGQAAYYQRNANKYKWSERHYSGIIIHAKDEAVLAKAKKLTKGVAEEEWGKTIVTALNNDSVKVVRIERGLFKKGDHATIDRLVFKDKTKTVKEQKELPVTGVCGKLIKQPRTYKDVKGQVTTDFQNEQEDKWVEELQKRYKVVINQDVVATVNKH